MKHTAAGLFSLMIAGAWSSPALAQDEVMSHSFRGLDFTVQFRREGGPVNPTFIIRVDVLQADARSIASFEEPVDGWLSRSWISDLDDDGDPELAYTIRSIGSDGSETLNFFEFDDGELRARALPPMPDRFSTTYRGHNLFEFSADDISNRFPLYGADDPNCCPTAGDAEIEYAYMGNRLVINDID